MVGFKSSRRARATRVVVTLLCLAFGPVRAWAEDPPPIPTGGDAPPAENTAPVGTAPQNAEAAAAASRGRDLYRQGKFLEALLEFQKSYDLEKNSAQSYNIARCYEQLSQWEDAIKAYDRFMNDTTNPRERAEAADKIEFLRTKAGPDLSSVEGRYKARIDNGKKAFARGDYEAAIQEFKAAYDLKATAAVLFNIAKAYERMARYEEAIDFFTQYLTADPNAPDKADVEEQIRRLQKSIRERFQELAVSSEPPGAEIYLDDRNTGLQGQTNMRLKIAPGPHTLFVDLNGYEPLKREFTMPDDKPLALEFSLKKLENIGYAIITANVDGARIFVDGAIVGLTPYTQKKALSAGPHQVTIEAVGRPRFTQDFVIEKDKELALNAVLPEYSEPVRDETLEKWGRNLLIVGIVGGGLGFAGPFAYQKLIMRRTLYSHVAPSSSLDEAGNAIVWRGVPAEGTTGNWYVENKTKTTLETIQTISIISGSALAAAGLGFYIYKWVRDPERREVVTADASDQAIEQQIDALVADEPSTSPIEITSFGFSPTTDGASWGLVGTF